MTGPQLTASVGDGGRNLRPDVERLQLALAEAAALTLDARLHPGPADGLCGVGTEGAIERLQRRIGVAKPDARADPGGYTLERLGALLAIGTVDIQFPFKRSSRWPYTGPRAGMRAFGARRSGGKRAHAGVDLYQPDHEPVLAVADGEVLRVAFFYLDTWAVEVDHGPFVARYGEVGADAAMKLRRGQELRQGERLGRVGILKRSNGKRLGVPSMMLHFEMYDKTASGPLTADTAAEVAAGAFHTNGRPFKRRRDLVDPTGFLRRARLPE